MTSLESLRRELPALALTVGFAARDQREASAVLLLLWVELRRAGLASEPIIAATRMAWWRDALETGRTEGVPLAEQLLNHAGARVISAGLGALVETTLQEGRSIPPHDLIAGQLAVVLDADANAIAAILARLDGALAGRAGEPAPKAGHAVPDLINWCCAKPSRLAYPDQHPMLALAMMLAALRL